MKKILLFLFIAFPIFGQINISAPGVTGLEDYSTGTTETDTLRTRYIRILDGTNSDSIASYIYFDGDTSRWAGDPIKIGNNSIIVKDDTVKISNAMLTVSGQVQADTLVPYHNSTIYIRHFTVDTIEIVKYFHQQEIGVVDSLTWFASDGDTVKIDPSVGENVFEYKDENVMVAKLDSAGNWTAQNIIAEGKFAKGTTNPLFDLSIVNSNPATNNGIHIVDSNVNKNRTTYAQATDSASAMLSTIGGNGWLRLRASNADTGSIYVTSSYLYIYSTDGVCVGPPLYTDNVLAATSDYRNIGALGNKYKAGWFSDNIYLGGKGQTAKLTIGTMNTMTEETDSCVVVTPVNGSGAVKLASALGAIAQFVGVQPATYNAAAGDIWWSLNTGGTGKDTLFVATSADSVTYFLGAARAKAH